MPANSCNVHSAGSPTRLCGFGFHTNAYRWKSFRLPLTQKAINWEKATEIQTSQWVERYVRTLIELNWTLFCIRISFGLDRARVRIPWPGSPRTKESVSPNQSPKQGSPAADFSPSSPSYQHFPKQVKSPSSTRRVPRKKSLRKTKVS